MDEHGDEAPEATGDEGAGDHDETHGLDPHVWLDPLLYAKMVNRLAEELGRGAAAQALGDELAALDQEFEQALADCDRRVLVTSHEAFGYLADRYGLEQIGVTGISPEAEPSPGDLERVIDAVRESGATTVFTETLLSPELAETVAGRRGPTSPCSTRSRV